VEGGRTPGNPGWRKKEDGGKGRSGTSPRDTPKRTLGKPVRKASMAFSDVKPVHLHGVAESGSSCRPQGFSKSACAGITCHWRALVPAGDGFCKPSSSPLMAFSRDSGSRRVRSSSAVSRLGVWPTVSGRPHHTTVPILQRSPFRREVSPWSPLREATSWPPSGTGCRRRSSFRPRGFAPPRRFTPPVSRVCIATRSQP